MAPLVIRGLEKNGHYREEIKHNFYWNSESKTSIWLIIIGSRYVCESGSASTCIYII